MLELSQKKLWTKYDFSPMQYAQIHYICLTSVLIWGRTYDASSFMQWFGFMQQWYISDNFFSDSLHVFKFYGKITLLSSKSSANSIFMMVGDLQASYYIHQSNKFCNLSISSFWYRGFFYIFIIYTYIFCSLLFRFMWMQLMFVKQMFDLAILQVVSSTEYNDFPADITLIAFPVSDTLRKQ